MKRIEIPLKNEKHRVFKILMIGNSFCQFYIDELYGMARAADIECKIVSVIAGACTLQRHWTWYESNEKNYTMLIFDENGSSSVNDMGLDDCLAQDEWDVISYQDGEYYYRLGGLEDARKNTEPYLTNLVRYIRGRFPDAVHVFHHVWAYQTGYYRPQKSPFKVETCEAQNKMHEDLSSIALEACQRHGLFRIPSGDAWRIARQDVRVGDTLCMPDCEHDGELQGGQYLNACVWFETLFGRSCIENPFSPAYALPAEKITALREAAHRAVADVYGSDYAK